MLEEHFWEALLQHTGRDKPAHQHARVWASMQTRASSRPMDAVLSTMNLFGVRLDPYTLSSGTHERLAATIKLLQAYLDQGGRAWWLECVFNLFRFERPPFFRYGSAKDLEADQRDRPYLEKRACYLLEYFDPSSLTYSSSRYRRALHPSMDHFQAPHAKIDNTGYLVLDLRAISMKASTFLQAFSPTHNLQLQQALNHVPLGLTFEILKFNPAAPSDNKEYCCK